MATSPAPDPVLASLQAWAAARTAVQAVLLTSTRAVPAATPDALSDYDVILVADAVEPFHADRAWIADFGEVLVTYWDPLYPDPVTGLTVFGNVIQYAAGPRIDFTLWPVQLLQRLAAERRLTTELDAGYVVLLDQAGLAAQLPPPTYQAYTPQPPSAADYARHVEEFLSDAPHVAKCLRRGDLFPAKWALDFDMKHVYLRPMLEWLAALDYPGAPKIGALGKGLARRLPAGLWREVEAAYAAADPAANWAALYQTLAVYEQAATQVGRRLGYAYPTALHQRVVAFVRQLQTLPLPAPAQPIP